MGLFDVVYRGSDEMYFKAEAAVKETIEKIGADAPVAFGNTAYYLSCIKAYTGLEVKTMGELEAALVPIRAMMTRGGHTADVFHSGVATAMAAEVIEACKYAVNPKPYGDEYHGHMSDAEVRTLGVPLVTGEIAEDIASYYATSEQIPTVCSLGVLVNPDLPVRSAGGFLVQLLPFADEKVIDIIEQNVAKIRPVSAMLDEGITENNFDKVYYIADNIHTLLVGSSGSGKSRSVIIPTITMLGLAR